MPPQLRFLDLEANDLEALPPCLSRMAALTALRAAFNPLRALPPGPYLSRLQRLDLAYTLVK
jgi:Leucine-rich repeat (LRR) protein